MGQEKLYIEKELSWLSFNERVLQEAADKSNPLIERMRFLGIYASLVPVCICDNTAAVSQTVPSANMICSIW